MEHDDRGRLIGFLEGIRSGSMYPRVRNRIDAIVRGWIMLGVLFGGSGIVFALVILQSARDDERFVAMLGFIGLVLGWFTIEFALYLKERLPLP